MPRLKRYTRTISIRMNEAEAKEFALHPVAQRRGLSEAARMAIKEVYDIERRIESRRLRDQEQRNFLNVVTEYDIKSDPEVAWGMGGGLPA